MRTESVPYIRFGGEKYVDKRYYNEALNIIERFREENKKLNMEIGKYAGNVGELAQEMIRP